MRSLRAILLVGVTTAALTVGSIAPAAAAVQPASAPALTVVSAASTPTATTFRLPLASKSYSVSSYFGPRCIPIQGGPTVHRGIDLAAAGGAPIYSIAAGVVIATVDGTSSREGYVAVRHLIGGVEYKSVYMHVWKSTTRVKVGQTVSAGQRLSEVGSSGASSGNHLHLELWRSTSAGFVAIDPAAFLQPRGVNLYTSSYAVNAKPTPATCTYYTVGGVNFRTGPSTSHSIIRMLPLATAVVHVPGLITNGFIPVKVGTQSGWVSAGLVTPTRPSGAPAVVTPPPAPAPTPAPTPTPTSTYLTTDALNLRATASTSGTRILLIPKGANVGVILASSGVWRKVAYLGKTGWVHSAYLIVKR